MRRAPDAITGLRYRTTIGCQKGTTMMSARRLLLGLAIVVAAVSARVAVVSAGYENRWDFPKPEVRERWERSGATMIVTGDSGAVSVALGADGSAVTAERDGRHRYWQTPKFPW